MTTLAEPTVDSSVEAGDQQPSRHPARWIAIALAVLLFGFLVVLATREPASRLEADSPLLGKPAPEIEGPAFDGEVVRLSDLRGRYVVVNFFATWCVPCREEHDDLVRFSDRHATAGDAVILSVIYDDRQSRVRDFFAKRGGDWSVVDDSGAKVDFGVRGVPESFLIDPEGFVLARIVGGVRTDALEELLQRAKARA